jgi:hypothetical protein
MKKTSNFRSIEKEKHEPNKTPFFSCNVGCYMLFLFLDGDTSVKGVTKKNVTVTKITKGTILEQVLAASQAAGKRTSRPEKADNLQRLSD